MWLFGTKKRLSPGNIERHLFFQNCTGFEKVLRHGGRHRSIISTMISSNEIIIDEGVQVKCMYAKCDHNGKSINLKTLLEGCLESGE